jgi:integrase
MIAIQPLESLAKTSFSYPDKYTHDSIKLITPKDDFVMSRTDTGVVLSRYGDNIWDFNPYKSNPSQYATIYFNKYELHREQIKDGKKLLFAFIIFGTGRNGSTYSVETIKITWSSAIVPLLQYVNRNKITLDYILSNNDTLEKCIYQICDSSSRVSAIGSLLNFLHTTHNGILDIEYIASKQIQAFLYEQLLIYDKKKQQTVTIPSRILSESLKQRWEQISEIETNLDSILEFLKHFLKSECFAIAQSNFKKFNCNKKHNGYTWDNAVQKYKLQTLFDKYDITERANFQSFIKKIQGTCKHLIHAYSGMRNGEVLNLENNCLSNIDDGKIVRLISTTTKYNGGKKESQWVTTKEVERIVKLLSSVNSIILEHYEIDKETNPLFLKTSMLKSNGKYTSEDDIFSIGFKDVDQLPLNESLLRMNKDDIEEVEYIDLKRSLSNNHIYKVGELWKFNSHQYRRSLAVYALRSGLVELGSLQIQYKHIFREMTMYYGSGTSRSKDTLSLSSNHIAHDIKKLKPEIDALSFIQEIIFSDEQLFGAAGKTIEKTHDKTTGINNYLLNNREKTMKKFHNGELAFKETALGACLSIEACDEFITSPLATCMECDSSVIKLSKVNKAINVQKNFIIKLEKDSVEYKTEQKQLKELEKQKEKLTRSTNE